MAEATLAGRTRRAGVTAIEVELANGQSWGFALPGPQPYPLLRREEDAFGRPQLRFEQETRVGYPLAVRRLKSSLLLACRDDRHGPTSGSFTRLGIALLRMTHDIDQELAEELLNPACVDLARVARRVIPAVFEGPDEPYPLSGR